MKHSRINGIFGLLAILIISSLLLACSDSLAPIATAHRVSYQPKVQAVEHWRSMANEVAERMLMAIEDRADLQGRPIFVVSPNNRPFTVAFYNLLRSELVSRGLQISYNREPESVMLEYTVQVVPFDSERFQMLMENMRSMYGESGVIPSNHDLVVNARMFFQNRFVMHTSAVRYISDLDLPLYVDPQVNDPMAESDRNIRVINR
jgi:hypothetical protein